ncbi:putative F-box/kelch-repeat protein At2g41360 [Brassica napus]|uniref:putative F-box/kelch-repeat protein At2g41360 n=1 Tax=Brassica napus TaxID=3708 RepID=UPI00207AD36A|nr:putative F-box/kelch-repeat protein At2g41360 [Brassica napus]
MSVVAASNSKKSRPSSSFSLLPDEVVLNCLFRVPRCYDLNLSLVSKALRSPELYRLRSQLKSVYLSYHLYHGNARLRWLTSYWITFRPGEKTTNYQLEQRSLSSADVLSRTLILVLQSPLNQRSISLAEEASAPPSFGSLIFDLVGIVKSRVQLSIIRLVRYCPLWA